MKKSHVAFCALCLVIVLVVVYLIVNNDLKKSKQVIEERCSFSSPSSKESLKACGPCGRTAKFFSENIEYTVDPCDDFYEFACKNFPKHHPLPDHRSAFGTFSIIQDEVKAVLLKYLSSDGPANEIKPLKYVRRFFKRMTDRGILAKNDFTAIVALERKLRQTDTLEDLMANAIKNEVYSLVALDIIDDPDRSANRKIVLLDQPVFVVGREDLVADESDAKARKIREAYIKFVASSLKLFNPNSGDSHATAEKILDLEMELAKITTKKEKRRDYNELLKKFSKSKLSEVSPGFDLARVVDAILGKKTVDILIVADVPYFKNLARVLLGKEALAKDLITWKLIYTYGRAVSAKFLDLESEFLRVKIGLKKKSELEENVMWILFEQAPDVIGRLYIDTVGFDEEDQERLKNMIHSVSATMRKIFDEKDWMDHPTKAKAKEKLDAIRPFVGYPKHIRNDTDLTHWFNIEVDESDGNFEILRKLYKFKLQDMINKMHKRNDPERDWLISPALVNAFYDDLHNKIVFPAAILHAPLYSHGCPDSVNYGGIGSIVGHEITHAFDDEGSQFGPDGSLVNWWSNETLKNFKQAAKKMIDQYGSIVDDTTKLSLNGIHTQGENIADNGGLRAAFQAHFSKKVKEPKLVGFEDWTSEKLFFLSYAGSYCQVSSDKRMRANILYDTHSLNKYRVNVPLSNFEPFAQAFQCQHGSKMNPRNKVRVW